MKVNGIIAEYNPFHNGHRCQLEESLRFTGADFTIAVMSGNFVQRGAPALLDKHTRAEMALRCGADLVLELPALYATSSAEYFAAGATALLDRLGVVTHLCFGSECGDTEALRQLASYLSEEPEEYRSALRQGLRQGLSYPAARARALSAVCVPAEDSSAGSQDGCGLLTKKTAAASKDWASLLASPNNILGIEYIRSLLKRHSKIIPVTVKRQGTGYHDHLLCAEQPCSALAIRQALYQGEDPARLSQYMPKEAARLLLSGLREGKIVRPDDFSAILYYKLLMEKESGFEKYLDVPSELSDRIYNKLNAFTGFEAFCNLLKSKELTYTRISRCLLHILLNIEKRQMESWKKTDYVPYARVLGFRKSAAPLFNAISRASSIPLVTKLARAEDILPPEACALLRQDIQISAVYRSTIAARTGRAAANEYTIPMVIL